MQRQELVLPRGQMGLKIKLAESFDLTLLSLRSHETTYERSDSLSPAAWAWPLNTSGSSRVYGLVLLTWYLNWKVNPGPGQLTLRLKQSVAHGPSQLNAEARQLVNVHSDVFIPHLCQAGVPAHPRQTDSVHLHCGTVSHPCLPPPGCCSRVLTRLCAHTQRVFTITGARQHFGDISYVLQTRIGICQWHLVWEKPLLCLPACLHTFQEAYEYEEQPWCGEGRWGEKGTVGLHGIVAGWLLVTDSCSVSSAPLILGNLGHFQPVHM